MCVLFSFLSVPSAVRRSATETTHVNQLGTVTNRQVDGFRHLASETISVGVFGSVETVTVAYSWQGRLSTSVCRVATREWGTAQDMERLNG
jgi:hypothetical protein